MKIPNSIKNWAIEERPREKMLQKGPAALTDAELLAILISSGTKEKSALDLAREVLALADNNLHELGKLSIVELQKTKGVGEARAITIASALELGRRRQLGQALDRAIIKQSSDAAEIVIPLIKDLPHEALCVLFLNQSNKVVKHELVSTGGLTSTVADNRVILKQALLLNTNKIILSHNHPSGNPKASKADIDMTTKLKLAAELMDIKLLDHIIVCGTNYTSMADDGLM